MTRSFYSAEYESRLVRGVEEPRPWSVHDHVVAVLPPSGAHLLDVGCGTAIKTVKLAPLAERVVGVEPNERMRERARENRRVHHADNLHIVAGLAESLPFRAEAFDVASVMLAPSSARELSRVLTDGGWAIVDNVGERDKHNIKVEFGADGDGMRGRYTDMDEGARREYFEHEFAPWFGSVTVEEGLWATYYSRAGLEKMLKETPAVRGFDPERDADVLRRIEDRYTTPQGIKTFQHRVLVRARK